MKYQYRLVKENEEEESGLKGFRAQNVLVLTTLGGRTAKDFIDIITDPKYLSGEETAYALETKDFTELKKRVFGNQPGKNTTLEDNKKIYAENGLKFYSEIENKIGKKFNKAGSEIRKDKDGKTLFIFPKYTKDNIDLVEEYFNIISSEKSKKADIKRPKEIDEFTLEFSISDSDNLRKVLNNAGLESGKDYKLEKQETVDENLHKIVREEILKYYKK